VAAEEWGEISRFEWHVQSYEVDGTYKIEDNKLIATGDFGMMLPHTTVFTILSVGLLDPLATRLYPDWRR
jgi:hypothetical protein